MMKYVDMMRVYSAINDLLWNRSTFQIWHKPNGKYRKSVAFLKTRNMTAALICINRRLYRSRFSGHQLPARRQLSHQPSVISNMFAVTCHSANRCNSVLLVGLQWLLCWLFWPASSHRWAARNCWSESFNCFSFAASSFIWTAFSQSPADPHLW